MSAIGTEERRFMVDSLGSVASPTDKLLILEPKIIKNVYEISCENLFTFSVSCKNNKRFWLCQNHKFMCLYNLKGNVQKSISTKSGNDDYEQTKVVHYAGSREIRSFQFNDSGESLYSSGVTKYITDTRNKDICVTDLDLHVVVVVNQAGKFRFTYTGSPSSRVESFYPYGITTDSQCWILIADNFPNNRIHILDEEGRFLQFINCDLIWPRDICVDSKDNLFVADSLNVKRFK